MDDLSTYNYLDLLIKYRASLAEGRAKPDRNGAVPFIKDSLEYIRTIQDIDLILSKKLFIEQEIKTIENDRHQGIKEMGYRFGESKSS